MHEDQTEDRVQAYLRRLPAGLDSYPDHVCKGSVLRAFLVGHDLERLAARLPAPLAPLADPRTAVTAWLPEVHLNVIMLARRDLFFADDTAFVTDAYRRNRELLDGPLYHVLTKFFSLERVGARGRAVFNKMHRGIALEFEPGEPSRWSLHYPACLVPGLVARCYATAATAALELGGARVSTTVIEQDERHLVMEIRRLD